MRKLLMVLGTTVALSGCVSTSALDDNQLCYYIGHSAQQGKTWAVDTALSELRSRKDNGTLVTSMQECKKNIERGEFAAQAADALLDKVKQ